MVFATGSLLVAAEPSGPRLPLQSCLIEGVDGEIGCGTHDVLENRASESGRRIALKVVVLRAREAKREPDPLFILAGGPGQAATDNAKFIARTFAQVRAHRDIVLVDQRGTGGSNPLNCDLYGSSTQDHLRDLLPEASVRQCIAQWQGRADLRFYTSDVAMADLDEVRAAMGYERINLFGTSYGTRTAQVYMRQYPDRVRAVILKGVTSITTPLTVPMARDAQRAWDLLCEDCAAEPACHAAFPKLKEEFNAVFERLEKEVEVELPASAGAGSERVKLSRAAAAPTIRSLLQSIDSSADLPLIIHQAYGGDYAPLAKAALSVRKPFAKIVSVGVFLAVSSSEDVAVSDEEEIARGGTGTFLRDDYFKQLQRAAKLMPRVEMPAGYRAPVSSDIPTLLISGFLDPATPPDGAEEVAGRLLNSRHVIARYGSHSYGGMSPCVDTFMAKFIARGSAEGLDTTCSEAIRRPPFAVK
ncbi:MAG: alpha/beta fold hydrolase [Chthoniobacterales bacterium]|nr:alpha/beta fold hydrolase [Chthoniobacterales bacterium]